jgi:hypothetical protein
MNVFPTSINPNIVKEIPGMFPFIIQTARIAFECGVNVLSVFLKTSDKDSSPAEEVPASVSEQSGGKQEVHERTSSILTEIQRELFEYWIRCSTSPQWLVNRCRIILGLDAGKAKYQVAREQRKNIKTVRNWSKRWCRVNKELSSLEGKTDMKVYRKRIIIALSDATRPGRPIIFTAEQVTQIIALACEVKDGSDEPVSHWTWSGIAGEVVSRGIAESISSSSIGRFLSEARIKPHLSRYWLNTQPEDPEKFEKDIKEICKIYHQSQELAEREIYVVSTDEKSGIQALERGHATHPAKPGKNRTMVELREHEYNRHGTLCLIANFMVSTGQIIAPTIGPTRTEEDFLNHVKQTVGTNPDAQWIFVLDRLNTHQSESLVKWIARQCDIKDDLGVKGKDGILKSVETRRIFLSDPAHRIRFVYTPKHTSWMNQVEIWFSILTRRLLKRGSFRSVDHLKERILKFINFFNETMAKPFRWTYKGRPLTV